MKFLSVTVALLALGSTAPALAADLGVRPYGEAPAYAVPIYSWTGFYIGGHVGGAFPFGRVTSVRSCSMSSVSQRTSRSTDSRPCSCSSRV